MTENTGLTITLPIVADLQLLEPATIAA